MTELLNLIPSVKEVRSEMDNNKVYQQRMEKNIKVINESIEWAKGLGRTRVCFRSDGYYDEDLKKLYREKGYTFKPTGSIGGVRQATEDICWF